MLTTGQVAHFEAFGFLVLRQVLRRDEIATILREAADPTRGLAFADYVRSDLRHAVDILRVRPRTDPAARGQRQLSVVSDLL